MAVLHNLQTVVTFLIVLSILVVAHEWGHFIMARLFGIRVDDFSIGFGKRLIRLGKRGDTEYNIRALPLGGFVKIAGMEADEAPLIQAKERIVGKGDDPDAGQLPLIAENTAEAEPYTAPDGFNSRTLWQRSLVILAGPVMSFITGYVIFCLMGFLVGAATGTINRVGQVDPGGEGQHIDLRAGDTISAINGRPITSGDQMVDTIHDSLNKTITMTVLRDGVTLTKTATPRPLKDGDDNLIEMVTVSAPGALAASAGLRTGDTLEAVDDQVMTGAKQGAALLRQRAGKAVTLDYRQGDKTMNKHVTLPASTASIVLSEHPIGVLQIEPAAKYERVGLAESFRQGNELTAQIFQNLGMMIRRGQLHKNVGGVIVMYRETGIAVTNGLPIIFSLAAQLSISLAIFNLLPIPVLDGGHLLNFFIEWVRGGKKMTEEQQQRFMMAGLTIIGVLFVWIMTKNILQIFNHQLPQ